MEEELTKESKYLINFVKEYLTFIDIKEIKKSNNIIYLLFNLIENIDKYIRTIDIKPIKIIKITKLNLPSITNDNIAFPITIKEHIKKNIKYYIIYRYKIYNKSYNIYFFIEETNIDVKKYNKYVYKILLWLYIINYFNYNRCVNNLDIYIFMSSINKVLPKKINNTIKILNQSNINTAYTTSCPKDGYIVIYRKEEWYKVLMHETFHTFGIDFSNMNNDSYNIEVLKIFKIKSNVNLFEAYTEIWAEIFNILIYCYYNKINYNKIELFNYLINYEIKYSIFQTIKILNYMNITYEDIFNGNAMDIYKEDTNVLAYYIIKMILIYNYKDFIDWCKKNNNNLLYFKKTEENKYSFLNFIKKKYKNKEMLKDINNMKYFIDNLNIKNKFILYNLRMTLLET